MASKKRSPSFEIPDAVRQAGQSGWVYRTGNLPMRPKTTRPSAPLPRPPQKGERVAPAANVAVEAPETPAGPPEFTEVQSELLSSESGVAIPESRVAISQPEVPSPECGVAIPEPGVTISQSEVLSQETGVDSSERAAAIPEPSVGSPESEVVTSESETRSPACVVESEDADKPRTVAGWLFGLGLQIALVSLVVPLYLLSGAVCRTFSRS